MKIQKLLRRFRTKLLLESIVKSLLFSVSSAAVVIFILSFVYHILLKPTSWILTSAIGGGAFFISFFLFLMFVFPTDKKVATRIDEVGLQERVGTMLELQKDTSELALLQRRDATDKINEVETGQIHWRIRKKSWISCVLCAVLAIGMVSLPADFFCFETSADAAENERDEKIRELLEQLRQEVKDASISDELKDSLNDVLDDLEEKLNDSESDLEKAAQIEKAKQEMQELMENALTRKKIGEALQQFELTRTLGEAISKGNAEKVITALDDLEAELGENTEALATLAENLQDALSLSGVEESDSLYRAILTFSENLLTCLPDSATYSEDLSIVFDQAEEAILAALEEQAAIENEMKKMEDTLDQAKDEALGNEKEEKESEEKPDGEMPDGEMPDGEMPDGEMPDGEMPDGEMPDGDFGGGDGEGEGGLNGMTEKFYDPISGEVEYGEVFAAYYAEYLAALADGSVPEDLQKIMDDYFTALN